MPLADDTLATLSERLGALASTLYRESREARKRHEAALFQRDLFEEDEGMAVAVARRGLREADCKKEAALALEEILRNLNMRRRHG